jgi:hypothetical protein
MKWTCISMFLRSQFSYIIVDVTNTQNQLLLITTADQLIEYPCYKSSSFECYITHKFSQLTNYNMYWNKLYFTIIVLLFFLLPDFCIPRQSQEYFWFWAWVVKIATTAIMCHLHMISIRITRSNIILILMNFLASDILNHLFLSNYCSYRVDFC